MVAWWLAACGKVECGPGTHEVAGECVLDVELPGSTITTPGDDDDDDDTVSGLGIDASPGELSLSGTVPCSATQELTLENTSPDLIQLSVIEFDPPVPGLTLDPQPDLPIGLRPGDTVTLTVSFASDAPTEGASTLKIGTQREWLLELPVELAADYDAAVDTFEVGAGTPLVDLMLLIDHSCSMEYDQAIQVEIGLPLLLDGLDAVADWQLLQVTRDTGCGNGGLWNTNDATTVDYLVAHAWDGAGGVGGAYLTEALLALAALALDKTDAGECNEGFLRPGASLQVLVISDEQEQSGVLWSDMVTYYQTFDPTMVVSGVVDVNGQCGDFSGGGGYVDAIDATGGQALNICLPNWGSGMELYASTLEGPQTSFALSAPAVDGSIQVTVDGLPVAFEYDEASNSVILDEPPGEDATVEVSYGALGTCAG
ncbi:MAG: hypothetical protein ABMA64_27915 [Myxococcota bacterium]